MGFALWGWGFVVLGRRYTGITPAERRDLGLNCGRVMMRVTES